MRRVRQSRERVVQPLVCNLQRLSVFTAPPTPAYGSPPTDQSSSVAASNISRSGKVPRACLKGAPLSPASAAS